MIYIENCEISEMFFRVFKQNSICAHVTTFAGRQQKISDKNSRPDYKIKIHFFVSYPKYSKQKYVIISVSYHQNA